MGANFDKAVNFTKNMTLREKVGQISQDVQLYKHYDITDNGIEFDSFLKDKIAYYGGLGAGSGLLRADPWSGRCYGTGIELPQREECANALQKYIKENTRLQIPILIEVEASHGLQSLGSVMYPTGLCSSSSFNPKLLGKAMKSIGQEIRLSGNHIGFITVFDLARDPRWGRSEECFGEDTYLASKLAEEVIKNIKEGGALPCAKHFISAGITEGGVNIQNINCGTRELEELNIPIVKSVVDAGADLIMIAYNPYDGVPIHGNSYLLKDVLRERLGYNGIVLSDGFGLGTLAGQLDVDNKTAAYIAFNNEIDMSLVDSGQYETLEELVNDGIIDEKKIDLACARILEKKYDVGLMDDKLFVPCGKVKEFVEDGHMQKEAYELASESIVLAKNNGILPLKKDTKVCLIGQNVDNIYYLLGDYTSMRKADEGASVKEAFETRFDNVTFDIGYTFDSEKLSKEVFKKAKSCDVICLCVGGSSVRDFESEYLENGALESSSNFIDCGEGADVSDIELPSQQITLLKKLKELNKPIVSIVIQGRAYALKEIDNLSDAVLIAWYPGQEGGYALSDIVCGSVNPSGKLSVSIPASSGCLPVCYNTFSNKKAYVNEDTPVIYPFGHGLSYSKFSYGEIQYNICDNKINAKVEVENTSDIDGKEVVMLFVNVKGDSVLHRNRELKAFEKVLIPAKGKVTVNLSLKISDLNIVENNNKMFSPVINIYIGNKSASIKL